MSENSESLTAISQKSIKYLKHLSKQKRTLPKARFSLIQEVSLRLAKQSVARMTESSAAAFYKKVLKSKCSKYQAFSTTLLNFCPIAL